MSVTMRLTGLTILLALAIPASALAANADVSVEDNRFTPSTAPIQPGEMVTWRWTGANTHNVVASPNQTERFRSSDQSSGTFAHTFAKPGRFTYVCRFHPGMRGAVEVGSAPFPDTILPRLTGAKVKVSGRSAKVSFRLSERTEVRARLAGPSRRTRTRTLAGGKRSVTFRNLREGAYRIRLRYEDDAGNKGKPVRTRRFRVR